MKKKKPLIVASGSNLLPRILRVVLVVSVMVTAIALLLAPKPWNVELAMSEWTLAECIRVSLWWAGLLALPVLFFALTTRYWTAPLQEVSGRLVSRAGCPAVLADCSRCDDILYHHRGSAPAAKPMG